MGWGWLNAISRDMNGPGGRVFECLDGGMSTNGTGGYQYEWTIARYAVKMVDCVGGLKADLC